LAVQQEHFSRERSHFGEKFFGKLQSAFAPFLNYSLVLADPILSGIILTLILAFKPKIAETNLSAEQTLIQN